MKPTFLGLSKFAQTSCTQNKPNIPLSGIMKAQPLDFIVTEIDLNGNLAKLEKMADKYSQNDFDKLFDIDRCDHELLNFDEAVKNLNCLMADDYDDTDFIRLVASTKEENEKIHLSSEDTHDVSSTFFSIQLNQKLFNPESKTSRKKLHILFDKISEKIKRNIKIVIKSTCSVEVTLLENRTGNELTQPRVYSKQHKNFRFIMEKENIDTFSARKALLKLYKDNYDNHKQESNSNNKSILTERQLEDSLHHAGLKDKKGITSQFMTTTLDIRKLESIKNVDSNWKINLGDFQKITQDDRLKPGQLRGNKFNIVIRDIKISEQFVTSGLDLESILNERIETLKKKGFVNYFGLQRFGSKYPGPLVGLALIQNNYKTASDLLVHTNYGSEAGQPKFKQFLKYMRNYNKLGYKEEQASKLAFKKSFSKNFEKILIHSYQSWVYNLSVNFRLDLGYELLPGDFVLVDKTLIEIKDLYQAKLYNFQDLVIPTIGHNTFQPSNIELEVKNLLKSHGIDDKNMQKIFSDVSNHTRLRSGLWGNYRSVFVKINGIRYGLVNDLLSLEFDLPSSAYATCAVREILKNDNLSIF